MAQDATKKKLGTLYRSLEFDRAAINKENRTVALSFSSEEPYRRYFGMEILGHKESECDLSRLNNKGAFLMDHNSRDQIGVVEEASIGPDKKGRALVRFSRSARAEEIFQDVCDGIRSLVSVGYVINRMILEKAESVEGEKLETYRATSWTPFEVSLVSIPADTTVGVGRESENSQHETEILDPMKRNLLLDHSPAPGGGGATVVDEAKIRSEATKAETARVREIMAVASTHKIEAKDYEAFINEGRAAADFKDWVLTNKYKAQPITELKPEIGMSKKEVGQYSLMKAFRDIANNGELSGLEKEASEAVAKQIRRDPKGFFIPHDVMAISMANARGLSRAAVALLNEQARALSVATATSGGFTVGTDVLGSSLIELLRNRTKVAGLGARQLSGLVGNVAIPRVTGGATAYWLPETGTVTESSQTFGQLALVPHRLVGDTAYSKELLNQSSLDVEAFVRDDLMRVLAIAKDLAAIEGTGNAGQPLGLMNNSGMGSVTFGGAPTWAKVVDFETQIAASNADVENMAYLTTAAVRGKWKVTEKASSTGIFIWEKGMVNDYRAETTQQISGNKVIFGNWGDLILADWAGVDVVVDPYSLKKQGQIEITVTQWTDVGVRHAASFCISTDSGAQ